ncbi:MAG: YkgJ family cysteine cluster protein [Candidatus Omnitrophica bacterium]|nr:YkgJ family cysteine cluster protein [Candidatus Omnitrophota bacterium]
MTELSLKQFVSSEACLKCKGCCRYKEESSVWRPKLGAVDQEALADLITAGDFLDAQAYIKTIQVHGEHICRFLDASNNKCGIYINRPLECVLYPFILSQTSDAVKVYAHLSCPYVQDHMSGTEFETYVAYLKELFSRKDIREILSVNKDMFHDYTSFAPELLHLFDLAPL